jgi:YHS domain-containing protein
MPNPLAPIAHHWLDSTHVTFGVVTAGLYGTRWKAEASAFNGREPDEQRAGLDLAALDSVSGRVSFLPTQNLALQVSTGRLTEAEPSDTGGSRIDVTRVTASATYHRTLGGDGIWASTVAWGRNSELDHASNALLFESNLTLDDRHTWFGRFEVAAKSARDLEVRGDDTFNVSKLQGGYIRYAGAWNGLAPGLGMSASVGFVPDSLKAAYGSRANLGVGVFVTLRPMVMMHAAATGGTAAPVDHSQHAAEPAAPVDHSQHVAQPSAPAAPPAGQNTPRLPVAAAERVIDPRCARTIDLANAPRATYQSKVYYFCSTADRDEFVKDPAAYLKNRAN